MVYTTHGFQIPGSPVEPLDPNDLSKIPVIARCGGPGMCQKCSSETAQYKNAHEPGVVIGYNFEKTIPDKEWKIGSPEDYQAKAKQIVKSFVDDHLQKMPDDEGPVYEVYVVWFSKTLQNWKALLSTTLPDAMYFEVTYNGDKRETYLDAYQKTENIVFPD